MSSNILKPSYGELPDMDHESRRGLVLDLTMLDVGDLHDNSLSQNKAVNNGATWVVGEYGPALFFDVEHVDVSISSTVFADDFTVVVKGITRTEVLIRPILTYRDTASLYGVWITHDVPNNQILARVQSAGGAVTLTAPNISADINYSIAVVRTSTNIYLYNNAVLVDLTQTL